MINLAKYVIKHASHNQKTHGGKGGGGGSGSQALLSALPKQLNSVSRDIDSVAERNTNASAATDLASAKASLFSAPKPTDPKRAAEFIESANLSIQSAARKLSSTKGNLAIILSDASDRLNMLSRGLRSPVGG